jgi:hypothetical protein
MLYYKIAAPPVFCNIDDDLNPVPLSKEEQVTRWIEHISDAKGRQEAIERAERYLLSVCPTASTCMLDMVRRLTGYDHDGAPSNWEPRYKHERVMPDWAYWAVTEADWNIDWPLDYFH